MPSININSNAPRGQITASPGQTVINRDYIVFKAEDAVIIVNGVTLVLNTQYTVQNLGNDSGGTYTLVTPLSGGELVTHYRKTIIKRDSQYQVDGRLDAQPLERDFDVVTTILQELERDNQRVVRLDEEDNITELTLPVTSIRSGKFLAFDVSGNAIASSGTVGTSPIAVSLFGETLINAGDAAAARTILSLGSLAVLNNVPNNEVTNARLADMAANTVKVRAAATSGDPSDLALSASNLLGRGSTGDIAAISLGKGLLLGTTALALNAKVLHVCDQKAQGTDGGTFTAGAWQTRVLNTVVSNTISGASLTANRVTLPAGTYLVYASAPCVLVGANALQLQNITSGLKLLDGVNAFSVNASPTSGQQQTVLFGSITLATQSDLELQHRCAGTFATQGFGAAVNFTGRPEVYASIVFIEIN